MSLLNFTTAIPLNVGGGSGCYVGVRTLVGALRQLGVEVSMVTPTLFTPAYAVTQIAPHSDDIEREKSAVRSVVQLHCEYIKHGNTVRTD